MNVLIDTADDHKGPIPSCHASHVPTVENMQKDVATTRITIYRLTFVCAHDIFVVLQIYHGRKQMKGNKKLLLMIERCLLRASASYDALSCVISFLTYCALLAT